MYFILALWDVVKTIWLLFANACGIGSILMIIALIGAKYKREWGWRFGRTLASPEIFYKIARNIGCVPKNEDQEEA